MRFLLSFLLALLSHAAAMRLGVEPINRRAALMGAGSAMLAAVAPAIADGQVMPSPRLHTHAHTRTHTHTLPLHERLCQT